VNGIEDLPLKDYELPANAVSVAGLLRGFRLEYVATVVVSAFLRGAEGVVHPLLVKAIFDQAVLHGNFGKFVVFAVVYLVFGLAINALGTGASLWSASLENRIARSICQRLLAAFYEKPYVTVLHHGPGYFLARIYGDVQEGLIPFLQAIQEMVCQVVLFVAMTIILFYLSWQATAILAALVPFAAVASVILGKKIQALTTQEREQEGVVMSFLTKALNASRIVVGFGLSAATAKVFDGRYQEFLSTGFRSYRVARTFQALNSATMNVSDFLSMFVGAALVIKGTITFGTYLAFVNTFWRNVTTLMQIMGSTTTLSRLSTIARRVAAFAASSSMPPRAIGNTTAADSVAFSYGNGLVFDDLSLQVAAGEKVVIVGPNGSGKTTFANVLSGHLIPTNGSVVLPERISAITLPLIFPPLPVRDLVNDTELLTAFNLAGEADTHADELSSGQQQKLALALALSREADLYLVDEPLANLDPGARAIAMNLLIERTRGKSLIVIMHGFEEHHALFDRVVDMIDLTGAARRVVA
jgi:ABC-type bacteriocin/lantibiotic exporter with double-glycine peptidase domain